MLKLEREAEIVRLLAEANTGVLRVAELSNMLGVSEMTIRRDLESLERSGLVRRIHGGAVHVKNALLFEQPFSDRGSEYQREKVAIGREAASRVKDGDVILIDAGTTTLQIALHIGARRVTAVTNALPVATELAVHEGISAILLGGDLKAPELCTVGPMVTESLASMTADTLFLSASGVSIERGLTDPDLREVAVKRAMLRAARRIILVADSSKFEVVRFAHIAPCNILDAIVTDTGLPQSGKRALENLGVEVILVELGTGPTG